MLSIGKMSLACHVSVKTLRYYERIGLFHPALIDEENGYRYYALDQIDTMVQISRCKRLGFSLQEIADYLKASPEERPLLLEKQSGVLMARIQSLQEALEELRVLQAQAAENEGENIMENNTIQVRETKKQPVFALRSVMSVDDFGDAYGKLFEEMAQKHIRPAGPNGSRYYCAEFDQKESDIEVFVPVDDESAANASVGGTLCAMAVHKGGYSNLNETYAAIVRWIEENGYETTGAPYEIYVKTGYDRLPASEWETEVYFPVKKK